jgi:trigger factor
MLGSNTFIPGFEDKVTGMKPGEEKTFTLTFPKDYGVSALQGKKVTFTVTLNKVQEVVKPKLDNDFAAKLGPFKTVKEVKDSIKKELANEKQNQVDREFESEVVGEIAEKTKMSLPEMLIDEQVEALLQELKQNLAYRGQTYNEYLEQENKTDEVLRKELRPRGEKRVKTGLVLAEIANEEKIDVTPEDIQIRLQLLKGQYKDEAAQAELAKPEVERQIASQMMTEKTIKKIIDTVTK